MSKGQGIPNTVATIVICQSCEKTLGERGGKLPKKIELDVCDECRKLLDSQANGGV